MSIEICNLRKEKPCNPWDVRVDRTSVLGNPFYMQNEKYRNFVCDRYQSRFDNIVQNGGHPALFQPCIKKLGG